MLVPAYKIMLSASILIGCWWIVRRLKAAGWNEGTALNLLIASVIRSMLGSKLLYLLQYGPGMLFTSGALLEIRSGGYSLYGGLIGGCLPPFIYLHWKRLNTGAFANACAPAMALGLALTRTGCFLKGCNFGTPTDLPWGVSFPPDSHLAAHHFN
jgi:phosphatidylglycerol:prolipoprotein diacylglycerol transferase